MQISSLDLFIPAAEVEARVQQLLLKITSVQDASAECVDNGIITRGKTTLAITVPFEALWRVSHGGAPSHLATNEIVVELVWLKASVFGLGNDAMAGVLMNAVAKKLEDVHGVHVEGRAIRADAVVVLKERLGVELRGVLRVLSFTREGVSVQVAAT